jgi:hypothetical protein
MKLICRIFVFLFSLLLINNAQSQGDFGGRDSIFQPHLPGEVYTPPVVHAGSPWFLADWLKGEVTLTNGQTTRDVLLRYNGYFDELFWLTPVDFEQVQLDKQLIMSFAFYDPEEDEWFRFERLDKRNVLTGNTENVFAQLLTGNEIRLYVHRKIRETGATTSTMVGGVLMARQVLGPDYNYFLKRSDSEAQAISVNRRSLLRAFPGYRHEIRQKLRHHHIRIRNEAQLITAVELINDLLAN